MRGRKRVAMAMIMGLAGAGLAEAGEVRLPDSGQTQSYTMTVGEDHDSRRPRSYTINPNGTVIDNVTGLIWQQQDDNLTRPWAAAGTYCAGLTLAALTDWRLPTDQELQTLVNYGRTSPALDPAVFPGTDSSSYWSSTTSAASAGQAWSVDFYGGEVFDSYNKTNSYYVRCVRR